MIHLAKSDYRTLPRLRGVIQIALPGKEDPGCREADDLAWLDRRPSRFYECVNVPLISMHDRSGFHTRAASSIWQVCNTFFFQNEC
jgi:hypothetical protein